MKITGFQGDQAFPEKNHAGEEEQQQKIVICSFFSFGN